MVQSAFIGGVFNLASGAMSNATSVESRDAILIELQATGPNGKYVAMQYWGDIFAAIKAAVDKGITVVEAAGNGNENFDLPIFNGTGLQKDSGAIVVGAGVPPTNHVDFDGSTLRFPLTVTRCATLTHLVFELWENRQCSGLGLARDDARLRRCSGRCFENVWYMLRFSGTSSASPIVTGSVACLQGRAKARMAGP